MDYSTASATRRPSSERRRGPRRSLIGRLSLAFLLPSLTALVLLTGLSYWQARQTLQQSIGERLTLLASVKQAALDDWIEHHLSEITLFASLDAVRREVAPLVASPGQLPTAGDTTELDAILSRITEHHASVQELFLLGAVGGQVLTSTAPEQFGNYRVLSPYYVQGKAGPFVQNVYPSPETLEPTLTVAAPVHTRDGELLGVLAAHLDLTYLDQEILQRTGLGESGRVTLVNPQKLLVTSRDLGGGPVIGSATSFALDEVVEGREGIALYDDLEGRPVLGYYRWLAGRDLGLLVEISQGEAFEPAGRLALSIVLVGFVFLALVVISSFLVAQHVARPILRLGEAAQQVGHGDFTVRSGVASNDEIGSLANAFDQMVGQLSNDRERRLRSLEEREELIDDLEAKNAELERFTYTVSHDLKSPLVTIKGFLGMVRSDLDSGRVDRARTDLQRIASAADRMSQLLDELLQLARVGRTAPNLESIDLARLCQEVIHHLAPDEGIELVADDDLPTVEADRTRLAEVYENLLANAFKFSRHRQPPRVEVGHRSEPEGQVFFVRDNGRGIDPAYHHRVFELFERLDLDVEGTGIGLAIVRRIIEAHGGRIWIESAGLDQGTTVCFTLGESQR